MFYLMTCEKQISYRPATVEVYDRWRKNEPRVTRGRQRSPYCLANAVQALQSLTK